MRRQLLTQSMFDAGYSDSRSPIEAPPNTWAAGSCNQFLLGENVQRPFKGFYSQGSGSGMNYACQFGSDWGGLQTVGGSTGRGSQLLTYDSTMFVIGSGAPSKLGTKIQVPVLGTVFSTITVLVANINTNGSFTSVAHGLTTGQVIYLSTGGTFPTPASGDALSATTPYWIIRIDADTFRLARTYALAQVPTPITFSAVGTVNTIIHYGSNIAASSTLQVAYNQTVQYFYNYLYNAGLGQADTPVVVVPTTPSAAYTGTVNGAVNFQIAAIRDVANIGSDIDNPAAPVRGRVSGASAVVVPNNKTVQITFPSAATGQTHWAVFSTKEGFGGTGDFYRLGYRTSSDANAVWYFGISETTVAAATNRTLEFDYRTGDLLPETAWIEDYPPQSGTHALRLENIMMVFGAFDGTVAQVSLPNFFESYNPFHLLYFPEAVTAVLHRPVDDYAFVACRNSIHAVQYVGYRGGTLPSATITTVTPEIGIAYQSNWALGGGQICMFIEGTGLVMMQSDGSINFEFGREVNVFTRSWDASTVTIGFDPTTRSFVCGNGTSAVTYCLETGVWSQPIYNTDAGVTGNWTSAINSSGHLTVTLDNSGTQTAYTFDDNTSTTQMPVCSISQWQSAPLGRSVNIYEVATAISQGNNTDPMIVGVHTNLFKTYIRGASVSSSVNTNRLTATGFTSLYTGMQAAVFGTDIGGAGIDYVIVKLTYGSSTYCTMTDRTTGATFNSPVTLSNLFVLVGRDFFTATPSANIEQFVLNFRPALQNCRAWCVSTYLMTDATTANIYSQAVYGVPSQSSVVNIT